MRATGAQTPPGNRRAQGRQRYHVWVTHAPHTLRHRLSQTWQAHAPLCSADSGWSTPRRTRIDRYANPIAWPLAVWTILEVVCAQAVIGSQTDDFTTVHSAARRMLEGVPVYSENYRFVDPHYLYNPGATAILAPLGLAADVPTARMIFILLNAACIIAALGILVRLCGWALRSCVYPTVVLAAFLTESVRNTLIFSNINGVLLALLAGFLVLFLHHRDWAAGILIGLAIVIKPQFAPLLILPAMRLQLKPVFAGVLVPVGLNVVAWPLVPGASDYLHVVTPYLGQVRDYANASLAGVAQYYGMPAALHLLLWASLAGSVAIGIIGLARWRDTDPTLWAMTSSGILLVGVFLLSSLGQKYYSMFLFPLLLTALMGRSVAHSWMVWAAAWLFLAPVEPVFENHWYISHVFNSLAAPVGWAGLLLASAAVILGWWWADAAGPHVTRPAAGVAAVTPATTATAGSASAVGSAGSMATGAPNSPTRPRRTTSIQKGKR